MIKEKVTTSSILTALAAAIGYGGWAVYANFEHGAHAWIMAGVIQASYAFLSTLMITHVARYAFLKFNCAYRGIAAGFIISFIVMLAIPVTVHEIAGTPNILETILPGLIWGSIYLISFLVSLDYKLRILPQKQKREEEKQSNVL